MIILCLSWDISFRNMTATKTCVLLNLLSKDGTGQRKGIFIDHVLCVKWGTGSFHTLSHLVVSGNL